MTGTTTTSRAKVSRKSSYHHALERAGVPLAYLESYPYSALVLHRADKQGAWNAEDTIWSNEAWSQLQTAAVEGYVWSQWTEWAERSGDSTKGQSFEFEENDHGSILFTSVDLSSEDGGEYRVITCIQRKEAKVEPLRQGTAVNEVNEVNEDHSAQNEDLATSALNSTDCHYLLNTTDWSQTCLGPRETWSPALETMIRVIMASKTQDSLWVGSDFLMIYNQAYTQIVLHPQMYGKPAYSPEAWGPVWESVKHLIDQCLKEGQACHRQDDLLLYRRGPRGHYVEKYHTWSFIPLRDSKGEVIGIYNPTMETTPAVLARRRQETLRDLSEEVLISRSMREYFDGIARVFERNPKDIPFVMCYAVTDAGDGQVDIDLKSSVGVPNDHPSVPRVQRLSLAKARPSGRLSVHSLSDSTISWVSTQNNSRVFKSFVRDNWPIAQALANRRCVLVEDCSTLISGFPIRQWDHLPDQAMVIPIGGDDDVKPPSSVLIVGLNLQCPLDSDYEDWITVLRTHLATALVSVQSSEHREHQRLDMERMERAKTAWFQGAAHDLRSPLTLVAGPLADVLETQLTPPQRHTLSLAHRNVSRIQRLVNNLLDFSRIEAGKLEGRFVPVDLGQFVSDVAALFDMAMKRRRILYTVDIQPYEGLVFVDPTLLETVVTNLLSNALKYTDHGEIAVRLTFGRHADISVSDTGFGIPKAELDMVTDRFHRATTALTRGTEGTGIGLALAKEILKLHGGELLIKSETEEESGGGHGSTFTARIPLVDRAAAPDSTAYGAIGAYGRAIAEEAMAWHRFDGGVTSESSDGGHEPLQIASREEGLLFESSDVLLLVDDNIDMRRYLRSIFEPFCKVIEADNGLAALEMARLHPPDLILSDLMMPIMDGHELLAAIRSDKRTALVPILLLSAATDEELRLSALMAGAQDFMLKPFKPKELLAKVSVHMQLGQRRIELEELYAQREHELALLSDYCPSAIVRADAGGKLEYANAAWHDFANIQPGEDVNLWTEHVDEETKLRLNTAWDDIVNGRISELEISWRWNSGRSVHGRFIRLDKVHSGMPGILGCMSDITHQEERIREADQRRVEAEESKRQQELLVDTTSHEIRTPVSAILQCASLAKGNLTALLDKFRQAGKIGFVPTAEEISELEEDIEALESIHQCGLLQERIANDVLSMARIQLGTLTFYDVQVDIREEMRKVVSVFRTEAKMKSIDLVLSLSPALEAEHDLGMLLVDPVRLGQVINNLISNAIRFTSNSSTRVINLGVDVSPSHVVAWDEGQFGRPKFQHPVADPTRDRDVPSGEPDSAVANSASSGAARWLVVSVRDTGPGLTEKEQNGLFQRFSQGNKMIHTRYGGSGLGLFICKNIVELLGGHIIANSVLGSGSEFRFYIKCSAATSGTQSADDAKPSLVPSISPAPEMSVNGGGSILSRKPLIPVGDQTGKANVRVGGPFRALIVEDNIINQTVLRRQMIRSGFTCQVASNGQEAIESVRNTAGDDEAKFDVILMDVEMPVMDGLTAVKYIREWEIEGIIPSQLVIALTGNARQGQVDQAILAGMDEVIIKPYRLPELVRVVCKAIEQHSSNRVGGQSEDVVAEVNGEGVCLKL